MNAINGIAALLALLLVTEIIAAPRSTGRAGSGYLRPVQVPYRNQPFFYLTYGRATNKGKPTPIIVTNSPQKESYIDEKEDYEDAVNEGDDPRIGYIPVTDRNGATYLLPETAIQNLQQPQYASPSSTSTRSGGQTILVPERTITVEGEETIDKETGENAFIVPESALAGIDENNLVAVIEDSPGGLSGLSGLSGISGLSGLQGYARAPPKMMVSRRYKPKTGPRMAQRNRLNAYQRRSHYQQDIPTNRNRLIRFGNYDIVIEGGPDTIQYV